MAEKCTLEELVRETDTERVLSLIDPNDIENINKVLTALRVHFLNFLTSGAKDLLDIFDSGISSRSLAYLVFLFI